MTNEGDGNLFSEKDIHDIESESGEAKKKLEISKKQNMQFVPKNENEAADWENLMTQMPPEEETPKPKSEPKPIAPETKPPYNPKDPFDAKTRDFLDSVKGSDSGTAAELLKKDDEKRANQENEDTQEAA